MIDISIVIPFLNEEAGIRNLVRELDVMSSQSKLKVEVLFVDDGSTDNSVDLVRNFKYDNFQAKIIKLSQNYGSHAALRAGIKVASGKYTSFAYADMQDPLELQIKMYELAVKEKTNIVWGTRKSTNNFFLKHPSSRLYAYLMQKFVNPIFPKNGFDIALFDEKIKRELNANPESNSSIFLQILSLGFKQKTIYYTKKERKTGKSKWTLNMKFKLLIDSFIGFSYVPIKIVTILGFLFFILGIAWTSYIILRKIMVDDVASGWPTLVSILFIGFGTTNIGLGIIAEYLWRTLDVSKNRPVFIIDEIINL